MADYISREAAIDAVDVGNLHRGIVNALQEIISDIPAAGVRPVVRGRWTDGKCDQCGEHAPYWCMASTYHTTNFCPNCGADMREVETDG